MSLRFNLSQRQILTLKQVLSPKMIQMMKTFQQSYVDLVHEVETQSKDNVFLEIQQYDQLTDYSRSVRAPHSGEEMDLSDYAPAQEAKSLESFLLEQLDVMHLSFKEDRMARFMVEQLDERGFLTNYAEVKEKMVKKFGVAERKVGDILKIIQTLEPDGVGARSLKECLLIQLAQQDFEHPTLKSLLETVIKNHLDELGEKKYEALAQKLDIEPEGVEGIAVYIRETLNPNPGSGFSNSNLNYHVIPSFEVEEMQGQVIITNLEEQMGIKVGMSGKYKAMLDDPHLDEESRKFLKEKYEKAQQLIENIERRRQNLEQLARFVLTHQQAFIKRGEAFLEPLLQKEVAEKLGISPSTVSRICSSKFVRTTHGVFSFKQLCPRKTFGKTVERIKLILAVMMKDHPNLSDQQYSNLLKKENINMARRTVTKYRHLIT